MGQLPTADRVPLPLKVPLPSLRRTLTVVPP